MYVLLRPIDLRKKFFALGRMGAVCMALVSTRPVVCAADGLADRQTAQAQASPAASLQAPRSVPDSSEQQTLEFVREHQPKLLKLLRFLEKHQPNVYSQALKEMSRSQQRLASLAKRDSSLYTIELKLWQVRSELRLLAAELAVASTKAKDDSQKALVDLIQQESAFECERLELLKSRAEQEVIRIEEQLESLTSSSEAHVARQLKLWQNRIQKQSRQ